MRKGLRKEVYEKYGGHCAYCGKAIIYEDMQVDHCIPKRSRIEQVDYAGPKDIINGIDNLQPSCRRCNHYKRSHSIKVFREMIKTLHQRIVKTYIAKVALDYGIISVTPHDGVFYFERTKNEQTGA